MKQLQQQNAQNVDLLRAYFQHRSEPNYAWSRAISIYLALPALRGFWPMSAVDYTAVTRVSDMSGKSTNPLQSNNTPLFGYDSLAPYVEFDGINQYLSRADLGAANWADVTGTEAYIVAAQRGLTLGGWFRFNAAAGANQEMLMAKDAGGAAGTYSYRLRRNNAAGGGRIVFFVASGGALTNVGNVTLVPSATTWYFIVGRFEPSTALTVFVNDTSDQNLVAIPAAIDDSTAAFTIGARAVPDQYFPGRASMCFLCAAQLSDAIILSLYEQTRALYGV